MKIVLRGWGESALPSNRRFGLFFFGVFSAVSIFLIFSNDFLLAGTLGAVGLVFLGISVVAPRKLRYLNRAWMFFGHILGLVISPIIMAIIYFGMITPIALICGVCSRDILGLAFKGTNKVSFWKVPDQRLQNPEHFLDQF